MGARYNYHAVFLKRDFSFLHDLLIQEDLLRGLGRPSTVMLQDYKYHSSQDFVFNKGIFLKLLPPKQYQLVTVYPEKAGRWSLTISKEGSFFVVTTSIESSLLPDYEIAITFSSFKKKFIEYDLFALISGEELEIDECYIKSLRNASEMPFNILCEFM